MSDTDDEAEDLIARLSGGLAPADRDDFRRAAESALATSPQCWGPGSVFRTIARLWRKFFHPPPDDRANTWEQGRRSSKLIAPIEPGRRKPGARQTKEGPAKGAGLGLLVVSHGGAAASCFDTSGIG
ncbi:MAG TPA: hypothetical protein VGJ20_30255 [Xanthobacteraceae bacterium]|jgi:hypothetical protein